jgi:hypothetical protein
MNRYEMAMLATWREAAGASKSQEFIPFSKEQIVRHGEAFKLYSLGRGEFSVKNVPDIIYTYRAREDLPAEILANGHYAIIGEGKGEYGFARIPQPNRIIPPSEMAEVQVLNVVPAWVRPYMGNDEQGMLTKVATNELVAVHLGLKQAFRLQSHLRCGVPNYGQVEVDEFYAGETHEGEHVIVAVEAKDKSPNDLLNVSQLFGTSMALAYHFPHLKKRLLGVKPDTRDRICMCEFRVATKVVDLTPLGKWKAYKLV